MPSGSVLPKSSTSARPFSPSAGPSNISATRFSTIPPSRRLIRSPRLMASTSSDLVRSVSRRTCRTPKPHRPLKSTRQRNAFFLPLLYLMDLYSKQTHDYYSDGKSVGERVLREL